MGESANKLYYFATVTEIFGISLVSAGLTYEAITGADIGYILMTVGSVAVAVGSLLFAKVAPWLREMR